MKSLITFRKYFFVISLIIFSVSSTQDEDLIDLTDYKRPLPTDKSYYYVPILSTNDLHGGIFPTKYSDSNKNRFSYGGANYLYSYKQILKEEWGDRLIWIDGGDQFQGTMECMLSDCLIMRDFYNKAGLQGIALGNHDFDYGIDYLKNYIETLNFPLIVSNIKENQSGKYLHEIWKNTIPYKIFEIKADQGTIKIGVIGLATKTSGSQTSTDLTGLTFTDYVEETKKWNDYLRNTENVNAVIVLPHFGPMCSNDGTKKYKLQMYVQGTYQAQCEDDQEIMEYLEELKNQNITIDGVVAAHVHDIVHHWISGVPVVESSGSDYFNILYLPFYYNKNIQKYEIKNTIQIEGPIPICEKLWPDSKNCQYKFEDSSLMKNFKFHGKEIKLDPEIKELLNYWQVFIDKKIENTLAEIEDEMVLKNDDESLLANFINDVGRKVTDSDICFYNSGGIRSKWYKGPINEIDVFKMFPFNNTWVRFEMTGEEVLHMFQILDQYYIYPSSGLIHTYSYDGDQYTVKSLVLYDGFEEKPLDMKKTYKICTNDFLAEGGSAMKKVRPWYKELRNKKDFGIIRELITNFIGKMKGNIREDKFVDENYPKYIIDN